MPLKKRTCPPCERRKSGNACGCHMGKIFRFVEPLILLELASSPDASGYDLSEHLATRALAPGKIEKAAVYRTLAALEEQGMIEGRRTDSVRGTGRKSYRITPVGREHLSAWRVLLLELSQKLQEFCHDASGF